MPSRTHVPLQHACLPRGSTRARILMRSFCNGANSRYVGAISEIYALKFAHALTGKARAKSLGLHGAAYVHAVLDGCGRDDVSA